MPTATPDENVRKAILQSIASGLYPESADVASAEVPSTALSALQDEVRQARDQVENQVRQISHDAGQDIDGWIAQAKQVQADIERSKITAREIVQQAEANRSLKDQSRDATAKVGFLEKEVTFHESLGGLLNQIRATSNILGSAKEDVVQWRISAALSKIKEGNIALDNLRRIDDTRAYGMVAKRLATVKTSLVDGSVELATKLVRVDEPRASITIQKSTKESQNIDLQTILEVLEELDSLGPWLDNLSRKLNRSLFLSLMDSRHGSIVKLDPETLSITEGTPKSNILELLGGLEHICEFFANHLPMPIHQRLSQKIMPNLIERLENEHLHASVPISTDEMHDFEDVLNRVTHLADKLDQTGWYGSTQLHDWVDSAPRVWLSRRREVALGGIRQLLFVGLKERKTVERVETQVIAKQGVTGTQDEEDGEEAWDEEWTEEQEVAATKPSAVEPEGEGDADDEDASAWGAEFEDDQPLPATNEAESKGLSTANDDDEEAWGWGDEVQSPVVNTSNGTHKSAPKAANGGSASASQPQEITLREIYTVTAVPQGVLDIVLQIFDDAKTLSDPSFSQTPIAPAVSALYNLPTLILAMYRATASTSYGRIDSGNMLIYNDSVRLSDQLQAISTGKHNQSAGLALQASTTRKLDNDIKALESFAKRAYGAEMESQRTILRDLLDGAQGFGNCTVAPFASECDNAVAMTIDRIREVYRQWQPILSQSALLQSVGSLLSTTTSKFIMEIQDLSDIGEEESKTLRSYCTSISSLHDLFVQQHPGSDETRDMTGLYCPNWLKFQYLGEILDGSLADIKYLWTEGELSLEFQANEVVDLVEALFADSDYRRKAIADIGRSGR